MNNHPQKTRSDKSQSAWKKTSTSMLKINFIFLSKKHQVFEKNKRVDAFVSDISISSQNNTISDDFRFKKMFQQKN